VLGSGIHVGEFLSEVGFIGLISRRFRAKLTLHAAEFGRGFVEKNRRNLSPLGAKGGHYRRGLFGSHGMRVSAAALLGDPHARITIERNLARLGGSGFPSELKWGVHFIPLSGCRWGRLPEWLLSPHTFIISDELPIATHQLSKFRLVLKSRVVSLYGVNPYVAASISELFSVCPFRQFVKAILDIF
jgi:hypothetical protein